MPIYRKPLEKILPQSTGESSPGYSRCSEPDTTLEWLASRGIYPARENFYFVKDCYLFHCPLPGHENDRDPSFRLHSNKHQWYCFPCGVGGGLTKLKVLMGDDIIPRMPRTEKTPNPAIKKQERLTGCTVEQLAKAKGLPPQLLKDLGWYDTQWRYKLNGHWASCSAVAMRYENSTQLRVALTGDRFRWLRTGNPETDAYNAKEMYKVEPEQPDLANRTVLVVEGGTDAAAAKHINLPFPVRGLPGAGTWSETTGTAQRWAKELQDWDDVVAWEEPGEAAENLVKAMAESIPRLRVINAGLAGAKDLCELVADFNGDLEGAKSYVEGLIENAEPYNQWEEEFVANTECKSKVPFPISDKSSESLLWEATKEYFPMPSGTKPWVVSRFLYSQQDGKTVVCDYLSNSWRNPVNAQHKRRCLLFNILPRINGAQVYEMKVPFDDWSPQLHSSISKRIQRAIAKSGGEDVGWLWINNLMERGYYIYLVNIPGIAGFEPVDDLEATLVGALKAIHPPGKEEPGRFRPYGGSGNWTSRVEGTGEQDKGKWDIIAVSDSPSDFVQLQAECIASNIPHEATKPYWRAQVGDGLEMRMPFKEAVLLASSLGYSLTLCGKAALDDSEDDNSDRAAYIKAFACSPDTSESHEIVEGVL